MVLLDFETSSVFNNSEFASSTSYSLIFPPLLPSPSFYSADIVIYPVAVLSCPLAVLFELFRQVQKKTWMKVVRLFQVRITIARSLCMDYELFLLVIYFFVELKIV